MAADYPKRPKYFAHKFVRKMAKVCLANEIGPEACWMLTIIAHTEDAKHYKGPVTFSNGQLMPLVGLFSVPSLARAREKAVEAGWLHYEAGMKHRAGVYWVTLPERIQDIDDLPTDDSEDEFSDASLNASGDEAQLKAEGKREASVQATVRQPSGNRKASVHPSSLVPNPDPDPDPNTNAGSGVPPPPESDEPAGDNTVKAEKKPRERDLLWDAIVEVTGAVDGGAIGRAKKLMIEKFNPPITPDEVRRFVAEMPLRLPWAKGNLTPSFLRSNIHLVRQPLPSDSEKSNGHGSRVGSSNRIRPAEGKYDGIGTLYDLHAEAGGEGQPPPAA